MPTRLNDPRESQWQEWLIGVCVALLSLFAAWIVFGEDVVHLFPQPAGPASAAQAATLATMPATPPATTPATTPATPPATMPATPPATTHEPPPTRGPT